jgi:hypothetical protein
MALKEGNTIKKSLIGGVYRVKWIGDRTAILEAEDESRQLLTTVDNLRLYSSPQNPKIRKK